VHTEAPVADIKLRLPDDLAVRFDAWAGDRGGRSPALRHLIARACDAKDEAAANAGRLAARPVKLTVRLTRTDGRGVDAEARKVGLTRCAWVAALVRRRLAGKPTFSRPDELALLAIQAEFRRIGVNVNQIARALNTAVMEGKVLDLEVAYLDDLRAEIVGHMTVLREAFEGNLAYWDAAP
jgi:hypothetical protein